MVVAVQANSYINQQGVGLVEVLVALLLLAVAALGYSALQARSVSSTDEALIRTESQLILGNITERIRANNASKEVLEEYQNHLTSETAPEIVECTQSAPCTPKEIAKNDVAALRAQAKSKGIELGMVTCPGTNSAAETKCFIAAWNDTSPTLSATDATNGENQPCLNEDGAYYPNANCVYMEAY